jgi:hypothetical protein
VPSETGECPWVYVDLPRANAVVLMADAGTLGGIRAVAVPEGEAAAARKALAVLVRHGADTLVLTRGRLNGRPVPGGLGVVQHRAALTLDVPQPRDGARRVTLYVCADGLLDVFEYRPPAEQAVPVLCAACGLTLEAGDKVRRACPRPECGALIHADCATPKCPVCSHEVIDPTGEAHIWRPASSGTPAGKPPVSACEAPAR